MPANDKQVGGSRYSVLPYQHWDWVQDAGLTYLQGQATKYLARYPQTRKLEDLQKARHYCDKIAERKRAAHLANARFFEQFTDTTLTEAMDYVTMGAALLAAECVDTLIARHSPAPVPLTEENHHGERAGSPKDFLCCSQDDQGYSCDTQCNHCYEEEHADAQGV